MTLGYAKPHVTVTRDDLDSTDLFAGAGGSSTGAVQAGFKVVTAMNHWDLAMATHNENHPNTIHIQADISQYDPRLVRRTRVLWASPECTNHSVAKGKKRIINQPDLFGDELPDAAADRSRATMFDVLRFTERHHYEIVIVENVPDAARWVMFESWLAAMHAMGYLHHVVWLNSMHAQYGGLPAPQSRDRMYVVFWKKNNRRPDFDKYFRPKAYCPSCDEVVDAMQVFKKAEQWGRYKAQYNWRCPKTSCSNRIVEPGWLPASSIIDWSLRGQRIGDREKPLAEKTMARILAGLQRFGSEALSIDAVRGSQIITPVDHEPFQAQTTSYTRSLLVPVEGRVGKEAASVGDPIRTQTTRNETGLLTHPGHNMLMEYYGNGRMRDLGNPIPTIPTGDRFAMITTLRGQNAPKDVGQPFDTFAANGTHHALTEWAVPEVEDCEFRMLEPYEIKEGMAFPKEYIMLGNKRTQVKMAGNAVTPPSARDLYLMAAEALGAAA